MNITAFDKRLIETINLACKYPSIKRVGIFGSYARGCSHTLSDIDLLYDYDEQSERGTDDVLNYVDEIDDTIKKITKVPKIDYVWYKGVTQSDNAAFKNNVLKEVIWIYENY